jgi:hypothetical protein
MSHNDECSSRNDGPRQTKTCRRRPQTPSIQNEMVMIIGADDAYYYALRNFVASLKYWAPRSKLVVYNLGVKASRLKKPSAIPMSLSWHGKMVSPVPVPILPTSKSSIRTFGNPWPLKTRRCTSTNPSFRSMLALLLPFKTLFTNTGYCCARGSEWGEDTSITKGEKCRHRFFSCS